MRIAEALAAGAVRATQALGLRGGATLVHLLASSGIGRGAVSRVSLPSGRRISFPSVDPYWAPYLWGRRVYEPDVEAIFRKLRKIPGKLLVDGGANIGYWTVHLSSPEFGFDRFIAVEANPALIQLIKENVEENAIRCEVVHAAIAAEPGLTVYLGGVQDHASAAIGESGIAVTTVTLDALVPAELGLVSMIVIKLDIEGSEIAAFEGARRLIHDGALFIYEDWPRSGFPNSVYVLDQGLAIIGVPPKGRPSRIRSLDELGNFNRATRTPYGPSNLVACGEERLEELKALLLVD